MTIPSLMREIEQARIGCDLMVLFYAFDEYSDVLNGPEAQAVADILMDGVRHPNKPRPEGELPIGELARH